MTAVEIENVLATPELQDLFEQAEQHGSLRYAELIEVLEPLHLDPLETDAVFRELEQRGIEVSEPEREQKEAAPPPLRRRLSRSRKRRRRTPCSCSCETPAAIRCSPPRRRSSSPSASSAAIWRPRRG
jgi:hypothetical protein